MNKSDATSAMMKVLLVEDMASVRRLIQEILRPLGAQIIEAENGQDAIEKIISTEFDVVLMDIEMPIINGLDVLKQIRQVHKFNYLPVIMMTGLDDESLATKAFEYGAYDYVRKPIHAEELIARIRSVLERKRIEREMFLARKQAERSNQAKSEFVSHMTHELNTPLNAIYGFAQLLQMEPLTTDQSGYVEDIIHAAEHQKKLISDCLDLARMEAGVIDIILEPVLISDVIKETFSLTHSLAQKHGIELIRPPKSDADIWISADRRRFVQVLLNLVSNAIKYNKPKGSVKVSVITMPWQRVRLGISDTGIGISEKNLKSLFQSFNRLGAENSDIEGNGIGLAITKRMIELMEGTIDVESSEGEGTTFWVEMTRLEGP